METVSSFIVKNWLTLIGVAAGVITLLLTKWIVCEMKRQKRETEKAKQESKIIIKNRIIKANRGRKHGVHRFCYIGNQGPAEARDIKIWVNNELIEKKYIDRCPPKELKTGEGWEAGEIPVEDTVKVEWINGLDERRSAQLRFK